MVLVGGLILGSYRQRLRDSNWDEKAGGKLHGEESNEEIYLQIGAFFNENILNFYRQNKYFFVFFTIN